MKTCDGIKERRPMAFSPPTSTLHAHVPDGGGTRRMHQAAEEQKHGLAVTHQRQQEEQVSRQSAATASRTGRGRRCGIKGGKVCGGYRVQQERGVTPDEHDADGEADGRRRPPRSGWTRSSLALERVRPAREELSWRCARRRHLLRENGRQQLLGGHPQQRVQRRDEVLLPPSPRCVVGSRSSSSL